MGRYRVIFNSRSVQRQTVAAALLLLAALFIGQLIVARMAGDYKKDMIEHDYAIAGYLSRYVADSSQIADAIIVEKSAADIQAGEAVFSASGYNETTRISLLPTVGSFRQKYALTMLVFSLLISVLIFIIFYSGAVNRDRQYHAAAGKLKRFMDGEHDARLADCGEGSLSRLFSDINSLATSLTAHIENEKQNKIFLKDMISDISHQLKTPLAALSMYNQIISGEKTDNAVVERFMEKSGEELSRMDTLIRKLLKLSRLDADAVELKKANGRICSFLKTCIASFSVRAAREGKQIKLICSDAVMLNFDETWLGEAVGNIIKNALDHTKAGDAIAISCKETAVSTEIAIQDHGSGIHPEDIHHIFKRFYRSRYSSDKQGVGIGLALAKGIVEKHGGTITVNSELGQGTGFYIIFPKLTNL